MRLLGVENVGGLGLQNVCLPDRMAMTIILTPQINTRLVEQQIYDGPSGLEPIRSAFRAKL